MEEARIQQLESDLTQQINMLRTERMDVSFGELLSMYEHGEIIINPAFQRYFRWSEHQKTRFIESLLLGIPIPPIFVAANNEGVWELVLIERGGDSSLWLNFAISCISIFFSILAALVTLDYENHPKVFIVFVVVTVVTALGAGICGTLWWRNRNAQQEIFKTIRSRMK